MIDPALQFKSHADRLQCVDSFLNRLHIHAEKKKYTPTNYRIMNGGFIREWNFQHQFFPCVATGLQLDNSLSFRHLFKYASRGPFPFPEPVFFLVPEQLPVIHLQFVSRFEPFYRGFLERDSAHFREGVL